MINRTYPRVFYGAVLTIALTGAGLAARDWLGWPAPLAFIAVACVELGGVTLSVYADSRRQLGERALSARLLSAAVAVGAVAVNYFGHKDETGPAIFFAGMSALGYLFWLIDSGARRRDALRRAGKLPPTPPVFGLVRWLRHPWLTRRARHLALVDPALGLYGSLAAAGAEVRAERRQSAISAELRTMIAAAAGPTMATVAVNTFDMDEIARRLAANADYDGLAARLAAQLTPAALAPSGKPSHGGTVELSQMDQLPTGTMVPQVSKSGQLTDADDLVTHGGEDRLPVEEQVSDAGQVNDSAQVSHSGHLELTGSGHTPRGEDSPRQPSQMGQSAGAEMSAPEHADGDLFELAASLAGQPHYPLPRDAAEQARTGTIVPPATDGQPGSLSLADLFPLPTMAVTATVGRSPEDRTNGAHVTAIPPYALAATETPEEPPADGHSDDQNGGHDGGEVTATPEPETVDDDRQDGGGPTATGTTKTAAKAATRSKASTNERKIQRAVSKTPKATAAEIARQTRIPETTVRRTLAKLRSEQAGQVAS